NASLEDTLASHDEESMYNPGKGRTVTQLKEKQSSSQIFYRMQIPAGTHYPLTLLFLLLGFALKGQQAGSIAWEHLPIPTLPASIEVYETHAEFSDGDPLHAVYAKIDLSDTSLEVEIAYIEEGSPRKTPLEFIAEESREVFLATNGGFFSQTRPINIIITDGKVRNIGLQGIQRVHRETGDTITYFPTWAAWGLLPDGRQEVIWSWGTTNKAGEKTVLRFAEPYPNSLDRDPLPVPSLGYFMQGPTSIEGTVWEAVTATGGTPALVIDGKLRIGEEELINCPGLCGKHPRTAIGYTADNHLILMVVDGRQPELSLGATLHQLANLMLGVGCEAALNLDGGGTSAFIVGEDLTLNTPSDKPGMRAVGSAILIKERR
ncbi:MAG: phosphodiester glycosidase family protein, partial [Dehalococcoidia bacterium]